jgi:hypothetical protein
LEVLVDLVEPGNIWGTIAYQDVGEPVEGVSNLGVDCWVGYVALEDRDAGDRRHFLKIDRDNLSRQLVPQNLGPASRCGAQINSVLDVVEDLELVINFHKFVRTSCPESLLLSFSVIVIFSLEFDFA